MDVTEKALQSLKADLKKSRIIKGMRAQYIVYEGGKIKLSIWAKHQLFKDKPLGSAAARRLSKRLRRWRGKHSDFSVNFILNVMDRSRVVKWHHGEIP